MTTSKKSPSAKKDNTNFKYMQVFSGDILSDPSYQRNVDYSRVRKIVDNFNPQLVNPVKVSSRDGKYYVFDGQHTLKALIMRNGNKNLNVDCKVFSGLTLEEEAKLFSEQNGLARAVDIGAKMKAMYVAGDDNVVELKEGIEKLGIVFDFSKTGANYKIVCFRTVYDIYRRSSIEELQEVLKIILESWSGDTDSLRKEIIWGVFLFHNTYKGKYKRALLVKKLSKTSTISIVRNASSVTTGGNYRYARQILNAYNVNSSKNRLSDQFM